MQKITCPICGPDSQYKTVYPENLPGDKKNADFSARKTPDNYHYEMVRCQTCGLLYAKSIYENEEIERLYQTSEFHYDDELKNLAETYAVCLKKINDLVPDKNNFLEIGCGNGFLLQVAQQLGYKNIVGVEPSVTTVAAAPAEIKPFIIQGNFNPENFSAGQFDVVFFAMLIEHVLDANLFLQGIYHVLKPGGIVVGITHDEGSLLSKILKDKCPIINDEHVYVFNQKTLRKIFIKNNFQIQRIEPLANIYSVQYWLKMMPLPKLLKNTLTNLFKTLKIGSKKIKLKAGNIFIIAQKK